MSAKKSSLESLFEAAIAIKCAEARARFIKEQCSSDLRLRAELEKLLESDIAAGSFLEKPPAAFKGVMQQTSAEKNRNAALNAGLASALLRPWPCKGEGQWTINLDRCCWCLRSSPRARSAHPLAQPVSTQ